MINAITLLVRQEQPMELPTDLPSWAGREIQDYFSGEMACSRERWSYSDPVLSPSTQITDYGGIST
jgi:hypothetical protein